MRLRSADGQDLWLAYGMNVHPGGDAETLERALESTVLPLRARLGLNGPMGLALRLDAAGARALADDERRLFALRDRLRALDLVPFTGNGFVLGRFHGPGVKDSVYRPSWREAEREEATLAMAEVLAVLRGPGETVSLSTAPGSWRGWGEEPDEVARGCAYRLVRTARRLRELEHRTGTRVLLGLEPEPRTTIETIAEARTFFAGPLREAFGRDAAALHHVGVCYDVCHQAVLFEDVEATLQALTSAGIPVVKLQASCALEAPDGTDPAARRALAGFAEPTWLHQTACRDARGRVHVTTDLGEALAASTRPWTERGTWRTHFHVPVFRPEAVAPLKTTQPDLDRALARVAGGGLTQHLEIETYSWDALPEAERHAGSGFSLVEALAREVEHVLGVVQRHGAVHQDAPALPRVPVEH